MVLVGCGGCITGKRLNRVRWVRRLRPPRRLRKGIHGAEVVERNRRKRQLARGRVAATSAVAPTMLHI
jgi:hypothetical protein